MALQPTPRLSPPAPLPAFDPSTVQVDPGIGWRLSQGTKALQASAAQRGTLLTGATQKALVDYGQNAASQEYGNAYQRALATYHTNRETNALNFNQQERTPTFDAGSWSLNSPISSIHESAPSDLASTVAMRQETQPQALNGPYNPYNDPAAVASMRAAAEGPNQRALADQKALFDQQLGAHDAASAGTTSAGYSRQMLAYQRQQDALRRQEEQNSDLRGQQTTIESERERRQREMDRLFQERAARENAAMPTPSRPVPYLPYVVNRRAVPGSA